MTNAQPHSLENSSNQTAASRARLSVLMVTYGGDSSEELDDALESLAAQTQPADEIVLVRNGPLGQDLLSVIDKWKDHLPLCGPDLTEELSFPRALNEGLKACRFDYVARMDSDDVCRPERFQSQCRHLHQHPDIDVLGSAIDEFEENPDRPHRTKTVPRTAEAIRREALRRNPMNHMSVVFKRETVLQMKGYRDFPGFEDYELWVRMLARGCKFENLPLPLVAARIGNGFLDRRRGLSYARAEWRAMSEISSHGLHKRHRFFALMTVRFMMRLLPPAMLQSVYATLRNTSSG